MAQSAVKLSGKVENADDIFLNWKSCMKNYLMANDLWDAMNAHEPEADRKDARRKNAAVLYAIQSSCAPEVLAMLKGITSAKLAWDFLVNRPKLHQLSTGQLPPLDPQEFQLLQDLKAELNSAGRDMLPPPLPLLPQLPLSPPPPPLPAALMFELRKAIHDGNLAGVQSIYQRHPNVIREKSPDGGQPALHLAAEGQDLAMVIWLLSELSARDMEIMGKRGYTALEVAIARGSFEMVRRIHDKNPSMAQRRNRKGDIPLVYAVAEHATKNVVHFLYNATDLQVLRQHDNSQGYKFLAHCVRAHMFDEALHLLRRLLQHSTAADNGHKWDVLCDLSQMPEVFSSARQHGFLKRWFYSSLTVEPSRIDSKGDARIPIPDHNSEPRNTNKRQGMRDLKMTNLRSEEFLRIFIDGMITSDDTQWFTNYELLKAWHHAIYFGVVEVVVQMVKKNPRLLEAIDPGGRGLFFHSILSRQENIFSLYYGLGEKLKYASVSMTDRTGNTVLHMAAKLSPPTQLARISGAALQMQRELEWYKEVERIVTPAIRNRRNEDGKTAREVFSNTHKELVIEGEKWMKQTASASTVVGAFIITTMFAAAFNVPGGNDEKTGLPRFLHEWPFVIFMVSDAVSLSCGISSVLMFLGILSSRYSEDDFYVWLPTKMVIGLSTLFFSIVSMMVAFGSALVITLDRRWEVAIPIMLIAGIPLTFFILLQSPLLFEICWSTYGWGIFDKKMKPWY